jgi:hypothetical protein
MINRPKGALGSWLCALLPPGSPTPARSQAFNHVWLDSLECYLSSGGWGGVEVSGLVEGPAKAGRIQRARSRATPWPGFKVRTALGAVSLAG